MKRTIISSLTLFASTLFAATGDPIDIQVNPADPSNKFPIATNDVTINKESATVSELVEQLGTNSITCMRLDGKLLFNDDTNLTLTKNNTMGTSGSYSLTGLTTTGSSLDFTGAGTLTAAGGINSFKGSMSLNIENGAGGIITSKICAQSHKITINNDQAYGIRKSDTEKAFVLCVVNGVALTTTADLAVEIDFRSNTTSTFNVSNGATLFIESASTILNDNIASTLKIDGGLLNGVILFATDMIYTEYDPNATDGKIIVTNSTGRKQTITLTDANTNEALTGLYWDKVTVEGSDYFRLSGFALPQVPEPAEWAAIFGAIALGLAIYRRRK